MFGESSRTYIFNSYFMIISQLVFFHVIHTPSLHFTTSFVWFKMYVPYVTDAETLIFRGHDQM